jgi:hypothetical protein
VGFATSLTDADRIICEREQRLMIEDVQRGLAPKPKNDSDANDAFRLRLRKQLCKYASRRAG